MKNYSRPALWLLVHFIFLIALYFLGELATSKGWLNPTFFGRPSGIIEFLRQNIASGKLWSDLAWTLLGTGISFLFGSLAPLFILWFGLGLGSKVAVGFSLTFFIVLSSTIAGIRGVSQDHVTLCKTLGASPFTIFFQVTLPGAVPVIFSGLRLGLIYALLGVIGAEIIASEHGLGQSIAYLGSTFDVNGVMALLLVLALLGVTVVFLMTWLEKRLLHWQ